MFDSNLVKKALREKILTSASSYALLANKAAIERQPLLALQVLRAGHTVYPNNGGLKKRLETAGDLNPALVNQLNLPPARKIFGIGLSRTATSSLNESLEMLGYNTAHWMNSAAENKIIDWTELLSHDALSDTPVSFMFELLHYAFPNSHFIYTYRDIEKWDHSITSHFHWLKGFESFKQLCLNGNGKGGVVDSPLWRMIHLTLYANCSSWSEAYKQHERRVERFFSSHPEARLLKIDITDPTLGSNDKWHTIANYLDLPDDHIPLLPFPKKNNKSGLNQRQDPNFRMELPESWQAELKIGQFGKLISAQPEPAMQRPLAHKTKKKMLLLHIGTEKTGTTSIQEFLALNRGQLKSSNVFYPASLGAKNHIKIAAYADTPPWRLARNLFGIDSEEKHHLFRNGLEQQFQEELDANDCQHTIISNEHLHSQTTKPEQIQFLKSQMEKHFSAINVLVYFRRQDLMAVSFHSTMLEAGFIPSGHFNFEPTNYYFNFFSIYQNWLNCFGKDNVKVRIFAKEHFINGSLLNDFCASAGISETNGLLIPERKNEAFSLTAECLAFELNQQIKNGHLVMANPERKRLIAQFRKNFTGPAHYPDRQAALRFYQSFAASNKALQEQLPDAFSPLFNDDFSMYPEQEDTTLLTEKRQWAKEELANLIQLYAKPLPAKRRPRK